MIGVDWFLGITITSSILITVIIILRFLFKDIFPRYVFVLFWIFVLLKLSIFNNISSSLSIYNINFFNQKSKVENQLIIDENKDVINFDNNDMINERQILDNFTNELEIENLITIIWISVGTILFVIFSVMYTRAYRFFKEKDLKYVKSLNINKRIIGVYISNKTKVPFTIGIIKPKIIISEKIDYKDTMLLNHILLHESVHIKRMDNGLKLFTMILTCVYWYNPFVWLMFKYVNQDIEISCDEKVIKTIGLNNKKSYAESLIKMVENMKHSKMYFFSNFGASDLRQRMIFIMKSKKINSIIYILSIFLFITVFTVFATNPKKIPDISKTIDNQVITNNKIDILKSNKITEKEAINIALRKTNGGIVTEYELDNEKYEIEIINKEMKYKIKIDTKAGTITDYLEKPVKNKKNGNYMSEILGTAKISIDEAKQIALKKTNGGTVTSYDIEVEKESLFYEIEIKQGNKKYEVDIDAKTGAIAKFEN